jgi:hypothetical protein
VLTLHLLLHLLRIIESNDAARVIDEQVETLQRPTSEDFRVATP